mmetsp:Transcript_10398/g.25676  ORF Transcript_10398/g.25676 Transcript_10398/m.25676 type:complete len:466 (+) Transcript_10398:799-2196(+)
MSSMQHAKAYLFVYMLVVSFTVLGLSIAFHTGYGQDQSQFRSPGTAIINLMEIFFGNYNAGPLSLANGFTLSALQVATTALLSLYTLALALSVLVWSHRQVLLGLVDRETQDPTNNLRDRVIGWAAWVLGNPLSFFFGKNFAKRFTERREVKTIEVELSEEEAEAERAIREANSWIFRAKAGLKFMVRAAAVLRSRVRTLETEYGVAMPDSAPAYRTNNVWRKLRNGYQEVVFGRLVDMVRVGDTVGIKESLFAWRREDWGFDLEWRDADGFTVLHIAAFAGDPNTVKVLFSRGFGGLRTNRNSLLGRNSPREVAEALPGSLGSPAAAPTPCTVADPGQGRSGRAERRRQHPPPPGRHDRASQRLPRAGGGWPCHGQPHKHLLVHAGAPGRLRGAQAHPPVSRGRGGCRHSLAERRRTHVPALRCHDEQHSPRPLHCHSLADHPGAAGAGGGDAPARCHCHGAAQ